eukprot:m.310204 g.310204  ORF g.310204 m.310204 type:complete len:479 (+) comp50177_c0_seq1:16-1452(+)
MGFLVLLFCVILPETAQAADYYVAAVAEHIAVLASPFETDVSSARHLMMQNVDRYENYIVEAKRAGAQIIVLPEDGTYGFLGSKKTALAYMENLPTPVDIASGEITPCTNEAIFSNQVILRRLSCLARDFDIVIVANMGDVQPCHPLVDYQCPMEGHTQYNTDVVFDTDGRLLAKYHKQHLFFENEFDKPESVNYAVFETSFGVKFGVFTCFDILFERPTQLLVKEFGIKNIAFPTAWINQFPYLSSTEVQQAWSRAMGVNLLGANLHFPGFGFTGSGIYSRGLALSEFMSFTPNDSKVLVAKVPVNPDDSVEEGKHGDDHYFEAYSHVLSGEDRPRFSFKPLSGDSGKVDVCYKEFCCSAEFSRQVLNDELYAVGAYSGLDESKPEEYEIQVCTVSRCANASLSSCGQQVYKASTVFSSITVNGTFSDSVFIYPIFMTGDRHMVNPREVQLSEHSMEFAGPKTSVLSATLYGRIFTE